MSHDVVEELSAVTVFHNHVQFFLGLDDFIELDHIRVPDLLQNLDLPRDSLDVLLVVDLVLLEDFDSNLFEI